MPTLVRDTTISPQRKLIKTSLPSETTAPNLHSFGSRLTQLESAPYVSDIIVGSVTEVINGVADYTIMSFAAAAATNSIVAILPGTHQMTGNIDIVNDRVKILFDPGAIIDGNDGTPWTFTFSGNNIDVSSGRFTDFGTNDENVVITGTGFLGEINDLTIVDQLEIKGSLKQSVKSVNSGDHPYTVGDETFIIANPSAGMTINLPVVSESNNQTIYIKNLSTFEITLSASGGDQIEDETEFIIANQNDTAQLQNDSIQWRLFALSGAATGDVTSEDLLYNNLLLSGFYKEIYYDTFTLKDTVSGDPTLNVPNSAYDGVVNDILKVDSTLSEIPASGILPSGNLLTFNKFSVHAESDNPIFNQITTVQTLDGSSIAENDYFILYSANDETLFHIWYDKGSGVDPAPAESTGIPVIISDGDSPDTVATNTKNELNGLSSGLFPGLDFIASTVTDTITIKNLKNGVTTAAADGPSGSSTLFTFTTTFEGGKAEYNVDGGHLSAAISDDGAAYTDETADAISGSGGDVILLPAAPATSDGFLVGSIIPFNKIEFDIGTAGAGTWTIEWQYYDGTSWTALSGVTDGTSAFQTSGVNNVTFTIPGDWTTTTINSQGPYYYVRADLTFTSLSVQPLGDEISVWTQFNLDKSIPVAQGFTTLHPRFIWNDTGAMTSFGVLYDDSGGLYTSETRFLSIYTVPAGGISNPASITIPDFNTYTVNGRSLEVYRGGIRLYINNDYTEDNGRTITILDDLIVDEEILFTEKYGIVDASVDNQTRLNFEHANDGSHRLSVVTLTGATASYTADVTDQIIIVNRNVDVTINLPTAVGLNEKPYVIKNMMAANTVTIDGNGSETLDESLTQVLSSKFESISLISDNANWFII